MDKLEFVLRNPHYGHVMPLCVLADAFTPSSSQRVTLKRNEDTLTQVFRFYSASGQVDAHDAIARQWLVTRHGHDPRDFRRFQDKLPFLAVTHAATHRPLAGMLFREHAAELEAQFLYYDTDPAYKRRSLGTLVILRLIALARARGHKRVNLGLWSPNPQKRLAYKTNFQPCEIWTGAQWQTYRPAVTAPAGL